MTLRAPSLLLLFSSILPAPAVEVFRWDDDAGSNNWIASGNWVQDPGSGDYPGQRQNTDDVELLGGFSNNSNKFDIDMTTANSASAFTISDLDVSTNNSADDWVINTGAQNSATLKIRDSMAFLLQSSGSFVSNIDIELATNLVLAGATGATPVFNGKLIGGSPKVLNADGSVTVGGANAVGGTLKFTSSDTGFAGTIKVGRSRVEITQANFLSNATLEMSNNNFSNRFIYPNNTLLGKLTGTANQTLTNTLKVGNLGTNFSYSGKFDGSGILRKVGAGTLTLGDPSKTGSHSGRTYVDEGKIKLNGAKALEDSEVWLNVNNGLDVNGLSATIGGLGGVGSLNLGSTTLTIEGSGNDLHLGQISGTGGLYFDIEGTQSLSTSNSYSGGTGLVNGTLSISSASDIGDNSGTLTVGFGTYHATTTHSQSRALGFAFASSVAGFDIDNGKTLTWSGTINDSSSGQTIRKTGNGTLALTNDTNNFPGTLDINGGVAEVSATAMEHATIDLGVDDGLSFSTTETTIGALGGSGDIDLGSDRVLIFGGNGGGGTYTGTISGSGNAAIQKEGDGTFVFEGRYTGTRATELDGGVFVLDGDLSTPSIHSMNSVSGTSLEGQGRASSRLQLAGEISPDEPGVGNIGTIRAGSMFLSNAFRCDVDTTTNDKLVTSGVFDASSATLNLAFQNGAPTQNAYVLVEYGSLFENERFHGVVNLPSGYRIDYTYDDGNDSNNIALVSDSVAPQLTSITPNRTSPTNANGVSFAVAFSEEVTGVNMIDFNIVFAGSRGTAILSGSGSAYTLTVPSISGDGTLSVSLKSNSGIEDEAQNSLATPTITSSVVIDNSPPVLTVIGESSITLTAGDDWNDPGASADDNVDGPVSVVTGGDTVNTGIPDSYTVTYDAVDTAGNNAAQESRTVTVISIFESWTGSYGLSGGDALPDSDPDEDGRDNRLEFGLDGDPTSGAHDGKSRGRIESVDGSLYFVMTLATRDGLTLSPSGAALSGAVDGIRYHIGGSTDLDGFDAMPIELGTALGSGMPAPNDGWSYRSFRLGGDTATFPQGFLRAGVTADN